MDCQDFTIDVRSTGRGRFQATVVEAPLRISPHVRFSSPIPRRTLARLRKTADELKSLKTILSPREVGRVLYETVFRDEVGDLFLKCRSSVLRIRLRFGLNDEEADYLAALPWELLCDRDDEFLATSLNLVREIQSPHPHDVLEVEPPLRILVVSEEPQGLPDLRLEEELGRLERALQDLRQAGLVELIPLRNPTPDRLRDFLQDETAHVLHFIGHGGYHAESGTGAVIFARPDESEQQVHGVMLSTYLQDLPDLRLVVLNSCMTARYKGHTGARLDCGVASALVEKTGVLAVVANQYSISHDAAIDLSGILYGRIAAGMAVDSALTEARMRMRYRSHEWATPVLFLGAEDGRLFAMERRKVLSAAGLARTARSEAQPIRLGIRSIDDYGKNMKNEVDDFLDLTMFFEDRYILREELWQEEVFPQVRDFLGKYVDERRPLLLDFAAHTSIAFAAGWVLEAKSGLDVRVHQRIQGDGTLPWHPKDLPVPEERLWLDRPDLELSPAAPDVAVALAVSQPTVPEEARAYIERKGLPVGRVLQAVIAPQPGGRSVQGGAHSLRLAQDLLPRVRQRRPHERGGDVHLFCAAPNALTFYLGQISRSFGRIVLYEYPIGEKDSWGRYQRSIELAVPGRNLEGW